MDLFCVDPKEVQKAWPLAQGLIRAAIERTGLSEFSEIEADVLKGDQLLWLAISDHVEAAATTFLTKSGGKLVLVITACSGSRRERWLPLKSKIENYAKAEGCALVRSYARKGWERVLKDYRAEYVILEKVL